MKNVMVRGRPALNMKPTLVRFPEEILEQIDQLVGQKQRAQFIREAVSKEIENRAEESGESA